MKLNCTQEIDHLGRNSYTAEFTHGGVVLARGEVWDTYRYEPDPESTDPKGKLKLVEEKAIASKAVENALENLANALETAQRIAREAGFVK